jgi:hypothetical protein
LGDDTLAVSPTKTASLAAIRTRLNSFTRPEQEELINWAYAVKRRGPESACSCGVGLDDIWRVGPAVARPQDELTRTGMLAKAGTPPELVPDELTSEYVQGHLALGLGPYALLAQLTVAWAAASASVGFIPNRCLKR